MNEIIDMLSYWKDNNTKIVVLLNKAMTPVGSIYLDKIDLTKVVLLQTNDKPEKYCILVSGLVVMFSYYRKGE